MRDRWPYNCCLVGCCFQDLFNVARSSLVQFSTSFFSRRLVNVHVVNPYSSMEASAALKKMRFILSDKFDLNVIDNRSIAVYAFASCILMSFSVDEALLRK